MGAILGLIGTGDFSSGQRPQSWEEKLLMIDPNGSAPLTAILSKIKPGSTSGRDPIFNYFEERVPSQRLRINNGGGYNDTDATFTVDATAQTSGISGAKYVRKGVILWVESTGEKLYVSADPTTDTSIAVTRGFGTTAAAAIADDAWLTVIGTAHEEGSALPTALNYTADELQNYCQIFREPVSITGTAKVTDLRTGDEYANAKRRALKNYGIRKEMAYLFGELKATTGTKGQALRTTRGIIPHITTYASSNIISSVGALTEQAWDGYVEQVFRYGSQNKLILCGSTFAKVLQDMSKNGHIKMQSTPQSMTYGMALTTLTSTFGDLQMKTHPLFNHHPVLRENGLILDMDYIKEIVHRKTAFLKDRQTPGDDMVTDEFLGESGVRIAFGEAHMYLTGVTSFAP